MIAIKHVGISEVSTIAELIKKHNPDTFIKLSTPKMECKLNQLLSDGQYKIIACFSDDSPFALCIYHYRSDFHTLERGICIDLLFVEPDFRDTETEMCILKLLVQKAERENLDFLEIYCLSNNDDLIKHISGEGKMKRKELTRLFIDNELHIFGESHCSHGSK